MVGPVVRSGRNGKRNKERNKLKFFKQRESRLKTPKPTLIGSALDTANKPKPTRGDEIEIPPPVARALYGESVLEVEVA